MVTDGPEDDSRARTAAQFATTHWSVVLAAGDSGSPDSREALETLCRQYWYAVCDRCGAPLSSHVPEGLCLRCVALHSLLDPEPLSDGSGAASRKPAAATERLRSASAAGRRPPLTAFGAHAQGILHRDLKPANVLIDAFDEPRITDFGLAKRLMSDSSPTSDPTSLTVSGQVIGSPNFMPPEQAAGRGRKVGPASDIYGLGGLLYHLLTARPPFAAETFEATLVQVLETEPVPPRQLNPTIPVDLETICLKCLEKEPDRRYPTAQELADDLDRFLEDQPILARPLGPVGWVWRWCRRKPMLATLTGAVAVLLLAVPMISVAAAWRIAAEARHAEEQARMLRLNLYVADMGQAYQALQEKNLGLAWELIQKYQPSAAHVVGARTRKTAGDPVEDLRGWEWRYLWGLCQGGSLATLSGHSSFVSCAVLSPDGAILATASFDQTVRIWDLATRQSRHCLTGFAGPIQRNSIAFSPDGAQFAVTDGANLQIFETTTWTRTRCLPNPTVTGRLYSVPIAFSPDGKTLACNANGERRL